MDGIGVNKITVAGDPDIDVASTATIYTDAIYVGSAKYFAVSFSAVSSVGAIALKIEIEQSFQKPDTANASDTYYKEPENMPDVVTSLTTESTIYHKAISPIPLPYIRFKITGGAANSADTILSMWMTKQEAN